VTGEYIPLRCFECSPAVCCWLVGDWRLPRNGWVGVVWKRWEWFLWLGFHGLDGRKDSSACIWCTGMGEISMLAAGVGFFRMGIVGRRSKLWIRINNLRGTTRKPNPSVRSPFFIFNFICYDYGGREMGNISYSSSNGVLRLLRYGGFSCNS